MNVGDAIRELKKGRRVIRKGWNGKGMFLILIDPYLTDQFTLREEPCMVGTMLSFIAIKTVEQALVPWTASQADILAEDWEVIS